MSRFESISRFAVDGLQVGACGATVSGGSVASLRSGARVRVIGSVNGATLVARSREIPGVPGANGDAAGGEDPAQIRGTIVAASSLSAVVVRDAYGREFVVDAGAGRIVGGTAADPASGTAVVVTGVRATVLRAATIRIERSRSARAPARRVRPRRPSTRSGRSPVPRGGPLLSRGPPLPGAAVPEVARRRRRSSRPAPPTGEPVRSSATGADSSPRHIEGILPTILTR